MMLPLDLSEILNIFEIISLLIFQSNSGCYAIKVLNHNHKNGRPLLDTKMYTSKDIHKIRFSWKLFHVASNSLEIMIDLMFL